MPDTGQCWECRKRRLICDFTRPACIKCQARGLTCPGYEHKPLRWVEPGEVRSKKRKTQRRAIGVSQVALKDDGATALVQAIEYYNRVICPDLLVAGRRDGQNPFLVPPSAAAYIRPAVSEMVVSTALGHRILQGVDSSGTDRGTLATKLQHHRGAAIRLMAVDLAKQDMQTTDEILVCVLVFLLAEIQQSISTSWRQHVDAASAIIDSRGGLNGFMLSQKPYCHLLRYFTMIDILGATTAPPLDADHACRQLDIVPALPMLFGDGLQTCVPCPFKLLEHVILINHLRAQLNGSTATNYNNVLATGETVLQRICDFSVSQWVDDIVLPSLSLDNGGQIRHGDGINPRATTSRRWIWLSLASAFRSAVALYCLSTVLDGGLVSDLEADIPLHDTVSREFDIWTFHRETLEDNLRTVASDEKGQLRKFTIWPLVILGVAADASDEAAKKFVSGELRWISESAGTATPLIAIEVLQKMWQRSSIQGAGGRTGWDSIFDKPYIFAL